jgi:cytidylate kinase
VVTIDGPAGSGKSSVARSVAERLGWQFLDTGAMYRAVAWAALRRGLDPTDAPTVADLAASLTIMLHQDGRVTVDDFDVTDAIRTSEVTAQTRHPAGNPSVRATLVACQRAFAATSHTVTEGRDQGTVAFPNALLKVYLVARPEVRATRRQKEMEEQGKAAVLDEILAEILRRDAEDEARHDGPLRRADDAVLLDSSDMTKDEVVDHLVELIRRRLEARTQA